MVEGKKSSPGPALSPTAAQVSAALATCTGCNACKQECAFLQKYGAPGEIAALYETDPDKYLAIAFECSLCGLCRAVCPNAVDAPSLFLKFRQKAFRTGKADFPAHRHILNYEKRGTSKRYTCYSLPENCDTIFFPGCTLPGTRPSITWKCYLYLKKKIPGLGIVLDCCSKPSHDLGRRDAFEAMFHEMKTFLLEKGVRQVIVACPNCHKIFSTYGGDLSVRTVYEVIAEDSCDAFLENRASVSVHDPCPMRFSGEVQAAVRALLTLRGLDVQETRRTKSRTVCCGEGGAVGCMAPELARAWTRKRIRASGHHPIATYCAGCANFLARDTEVFHLLDLIFEPQLTLAGKAKVSRAPWTYWNRIRLKHRIRKTGAGVMEERNFSVYRPKN
jgi:Fe-S oxidoreductase